MSPQAGYLLQEEVVPRLRSAVPHSVLCVGAEDPQELIQDGINMAARMIDRVESQGKLGKVSPSNIAYYTIQHLKSGRRANGTSSVDIMASATQLNGSARLHSLNEVVSQSECGDEIFELHDVISQDQEDPAMAVARKMDWDSFCTGLSKREITMISFLSRGGTLRDVAVSFNVCDSTIQTTKRKLAAAIVEFMGPDIIVQVQKQPGWQNGVHAVREKMACREERRSA